MIKVAIVGTGTVSQHLQQEFAATHEVEVTAVLQSRDETRSDSLKELEANKQDKRADMYIIAVSDDAIAKVSEQFSNTEKLVVHTSGSVAMHVLPTGIRRGVFYPLQTFSKDRAVDFQAVPICVEAENKEDLVLLKRLGAAVSQTVYEISSQQRKSLHLGAVFVNNFTNHMYQIGHGICEENDVPFDILKPLIKETSAKIDSLEPLKAQTGPAKRGDEKTIENQLGQLTNVTHKEVYRILTKSIKETYGKEL